MTSFDYFMTRAGALGRDVTVARKKTEASFTRDGIQAFAREEEGAIVITYEVGPHESVSKKEAPDVAAALLKQVFQRKTLGPLSE